MKAQKKHRTKLIIGIILIIMLSTVCITSIKLMKGEIKTSGQNPTDIKGQSLTCESNSIKYPIITYDNSTAKSLKITTNFYDNSLSSISLTYTLHYDNADQIAASEAFSHAEMNTNFSKDDLDTDALYAHYSKMKDSMKIILYATKNDLTTTTAKYFMINTDAENSLSNGAIKLQENYEKQGFICKIHQ